MTATTPSSRIARRPVQALAIVVGVLLVAVVALGWRFAEQGLRISVQESTEASNRTLTRVFVNETWDRVKPLLPPPGSSAEVAKANPNIAAVDQIVRRFSSYTDVLKVKIYDRGGITVYSSERAQIGEDKSRNAGFQAAARGEVASELTYRGQFGAFDGQRYDRNLVSTYVPLRVGERIEGVLEIYADRTASIEFVNRELRGLALWMVPWVLAALLMVAATAWWLYSSQLAAARELARAEAQARQREQQALADATRATAVPEALPAALADLEAVLARARAAAGSGPAGAASDAAWRELLGHADAIAAWAAVRRDTALLARDPSTAADQAFDGDTHIDAAWTGSQARAQAAGVTLHGFRHPQPLGVLRGDAERMAAVLTHLLGASLDGVHGGSQGGSVQCKVLLDGGGLNVDVLDTGPGMDQGQLDAWFAAWDDAERWPEPDAAGLVGRRLVLARALVRGVGGRFDARSTPGHGNRFSAVLPCRPEPAATVASSTPANQPAAAA